MTGVRQLNKSNNETHTRHNAYFFYLDPQTDVSSDKKVYFEVHVLNTNINHLVPVRGMCKMAV